MPGIMHRLEQEQEFARAGIDLVFEHCPHCKDSTLQDLVHMRSLGEERLRCRSCGNWIYPAQKDKGLPNGQK